MGFVNKYAEILSKHPFWIIFICLILTVGGIYFSQKVGMKDTDTKKILPSDLEVLKAFDLLEDEFSSTSSLILAIELDPKKDSKINDVRNTEVVRYADLLGERVLQLEEVLSVSDAGTQFRSINNGHLPNSIEEVKEMSKNNLQIGRYINHDYSLSVIRISLRKGVDRTVLLSEINDIIDNTEKPYGTKVSLAGDDIAQEIVMKSLSSDMSKTSMISMLGIIVILFIIFRSVVYGLTPLATIGFGLIWAFGFIGLRGLSMSSASSGVVSMIMGIGIDFGIQTLMRFKQELEKSKPTLAIQTTIEHVFVPMATTTIAAVIGFKSMSLGQLTILADMGNMMTYGVVFCFLAAVTIVPAMILVYELYFPKQLLKKIKMLIKGEVKFS